MKILDRLPIPDRPQIISVGGARCRCIGNQIIAWISIHRRAEALPGAFG